MDDDDEDDDDDVDSQEEEEKESVVDARELESDPELDPDDDRDESSVEGVSEERDEDRERADMDAPSPLIGDCVNAAADRVGATFPGVDDDEEESDWRPPDVATEGRPDVDPPRETLFSSRAAAEAR